MCVWGGGNGSYFIVKSEDTQIFVYQCHSRCHSRDLGSRSRKGHAVHFPRPIFSVSQIFKVFDVRGKGLCGGGGDDVGRGGGGGNELKA